MPDIRTKQPWEELTFFMEFQPEGESNPALVEGRSIVSVESVTVSPSVVAGNNDVTVSNESISGTQVQFKLAGGTSGEMYPVRVRIVDNVGDKIEGDGYLRVKEE